jgi:urease accessory protein
VMLAETLLPGRLASGECHAYDLYLATTRIRRPAGELVALDVLDFGASYGRADTPARLGPYPVHAAFFVLAPAERLAGLADLLVQTLSDRTEVLVGVTGLPYDAGLIARVLGPSSIPVRDVLRSAWDTARRYLTGAPAPDLRKG